MNKFLIALAFVVATSTTAMASDGKPETKFCDALSDIASTIMTARQYELPKGKAVDSILKKYQGRILLMYRGTAVVKYAYNNVPVYSTSKLKELVVENYGNEWLRICQEIEI